MRVLICVFLLLAFSPAHALFLAGQSEQGGAISILCEGQRHAFISLPTGEVRALSLGDDGQAMLYPQSQGPHTVQCGKETKTISVLMPRSEASNAYSGGETTILAAGATIVFIALLLVAARKLAAPSTEFSKSELNGRVRLCLRAGCELRGIRIYDPQGGEGGAPIEFSIPSLPAGATWEWAYERIPGASLLPARLEAACAKGEVSLLSGTGGGSAIWKKEALKERRALPKHGG